MRTGGFDIGRWFGFPIRIDYSWFIVFAMVLWTFATWEFPARLPGQTPQVYGLMGVSAALLLFLSVLLHELAHSIVARARGIPVDRITLFIFGGVAEMGMEARRPRDEFVVTAAGPLSSFAIAAAFFGIARLSRDVGLPLTVAAVSDFVAVLNLALAVFNLIPAFPLDGGRLLRSVLWRVTGSVDTATKWAALAGRAFGWLLIAHGVYHVVGGRLFLGMWSIMIGWFLRNAAAGTSRSHALRQVLAGTPVTEVMTPVSLLLDERMTVADLVNDFFLRFPVRVYGVGTDGHLSGVVAVEDAAALDENELEVRRVVDVMRPADQLPTLTADADLEQAVAAMRSAGADRALVDGVDAESKPAGIVTTWAIGSWLASGQV